jgi:uncharacterized protein YdhG (YjbR/CyaY superfamily)
MQSEATTPDQYIAELPDDRRAVMIELRKVITDNLPKGFKETMNYGMIGYVVPFELYPDGYHCDPSLPLPFLAIASQKNHIAVYHMGIYSDPKLLKWFQKAYSERVSTKLDMGKSCIRFKNPSKIPMELIGQLVQRMTPKDWIERYESAIKKNA